MGTDAMTMDEDRRKAVQLLARLGGAPVVSGHEDPIRRIFRDELGGGARTDKTGSIFVERTGMPDGPRVMVILNSYKSRYTLPCGKIRSGEDPLEAARRELREEVGLDLESGAFHQSFTTVDHSEFKEDHIHLYETRLEQPKKIGWTVGKWSGLDSEHRRKRLRGALVSAGEDLSAGQDECAN